MPHSQNEIQWLLICYIYTKNMSKVFQCLNTSVWFCSPSCFYLLAHLQLQPALNDFRNKMRQPLTMVPCVCSPQRAEVMRDVFHKTQQG